MEVLPILVVAGVVVAVVLLWREYVSPHPAKLPPTPTFVDSGDAPPQATEP